MRREYFQQIVEHKRAQHQIVDFGGCPLSGADRSVISKLTEFLGFSETEQGGEPVFAETSAIPEKVLVYYDVDTRGVGCILAPQKSLYRKISDDAYIDEWGITRRYTGMYWDIVDSPLKDATLSEVERYPFPDPQTVDVRYLDDLEKRTKYLFEQTDYVVCASHPVYGVFELGCWMFGFDDFLYRMAAEPEVVHCFFERVLKYQIEISDIYYGRIGDYIHYTSSGDDFATQQSAFFSVAMFDDLIAPYFKERIAATKRRTKAKFLHHSCGNVSSLLPSLIECGVDILNPIQPCHSEMAPAALKAAYGDRLVFHGGLDTQRILPRGTPEQVDEEVKKLFDVFRGDSYIFAAAHNLQGDVGMANIDAMFTAAKKYK